jgi:hypothetical protein
MLFDAQNSIQLKTSLSRVTVGIMAQKSRDYWNKESNPVSKQVSNSGAGGH